jgi:hypothetical protein
MVGFPVENIEPAVVRENQVNEPLQHATALPERKTVQKLEKIRESFFIQNPFKQPPQDIRCKLTERQI